MEQFEFKPPVLYKGKDNKWFVRYSVKYPGGKFEPRKEYGRGYNNGNSLNLIKDLKEREAKFKILVKTISQLLNEGIDKQRPDIIKAKIDAKIEAEKEYSFDALFNYYCEDKGYINPVPKKELSAQNIKRFFNNQFKPYLESQGLDKNLNLATKANIFPFLKGHLSNPDPKKRWNNNTYNNRKGWIHGFFKLLILEDKLTIENPTDNMGSKEALPTKRFQVYTREERDILFEYFEKNDKTVATIIKCIYYAYLRESEISRLQVKDFLFDIKKIKVMPEKAKKQLDNKPRWIFMSEKLIETLQSYLADYPNCHPDDFIFGKGFKPSSIRAMKNWQKKFSKGIAKVRLEHPTKFQSTFLSPYGFKHSGVTHFVEDNIDNKTSVSILRYVQAQCRHGVLSTTEKYLSKLEITMEVAEEFVYN